MFITQINSCQSIQNYDYINNNFNNCNNYSNYDSQLKLNQMMFIYDFSSYYPQIFNNNYQNINNNNYYSPIENILNQGKVNHIVAAFYILKSQQNKKKSNQNINCNIENNNIEGVNYNNLTEEQKENKVNDNLLEKNNEENKNN
jgi:hypothetical protein